LNALGRVYLDWVPAHCCLEGNELADVAQTELEICRRTRIPSLLALPRPFYGGRGVHATAGLTASTRAESEGLHKTGGDRKPVSRWGFLPLCCHSLHNAISSLLIAVTAESSIHSLTSSSTDTGGRRTSQPVRAKTPESHGPHPYRRRNGAEAEEPHRSKKWKLTLSNDKCESTFLSSWTGDAKWSPKIKNTGHRNEL
jgi:hypothetical protein